MIVVDTSALIEFLVGDTEMSERVRQTALGQELAAPHAFDLEVASVLRRLERSGLLTGTKASGALSILGRLDIRRYDHSPLLPRIWEFRHNMQPYDAAFAALAAHLGASLVTVDKKFEGVPGLPCQVLNLRT